MLISLSGLTPRISPPRTAARKQPVPVAESQINGKRAPSGVGFPTTGLSREILLCSGVSHPPLGLPSAVRKAGVVWTFIQVFTGLYPHRKTKTERIRKGSQALKTRPALYPPLEPPETEGSPAAAPETAVASSSENLQIFFGFQKSRNSTVQNREKRPAVMSTRLLSILLDQTNCMNAKDTPTTIMAGSTSKVSFQPTMARTSQKGTITAVSGSMRPIMAFISASGRAVTVASICTGVPIAPHATGAVLAIRFRAAAWKGLKPRPIMKAPAIATGEPNPAQPSMNAPKQKATSRSCSLRSEVMPPTEDFITSKSPVLTEIS